MRPLYRILSLFIEQVHPETLRVILSTERILIPENHATFGNSGVYRLNDCESLVTYVYGRLTSHDETRNSQGITTLKNALPPVTG